MAARDCICVDIGSTWTKGARFDIATPSLLDRADTPTTQDDLCRGFSSVVAHLQSADPVPVRVTSSAKGGLAVVALGIVPDLTLQAAQLTAMSAGARVVASYAWHLTDSDMQALEALDPDIILLTGGTDGGNESYNLANAQALAGSSISAPVVYAGNRSLVAQVREVLDKQRLVVTNNVMPELGRLVPEPARAAIRQVFLDTIVQGKGLAQVAAESREDIVPTPLAVFALAEALDRHGDLGTFCLADPGGATTDVYSCMDAVADPAVTLRGIEPPHVMRTVEGDIGMRVSLESLLESAGDFLEQTMASRGLDHGMFDAFTTRAAADHAATPESDDQHRCDALLATACLRTALGRHAGRLREVFTPEGPRLVQTGKDLRDCTTIIATGGFLSRACPPDLLAQALTPPPVHDGAPSLVPCHAALMVDRDYLVPLAASLAVDCPETAVALMQHSLQSAAATAKGPR